MASSLETLKTTHGVTVRWRSYELRPAGSPPIPEWYRERIKAARPQFEAMAKERYNLVIHSGPFGINSRPALLGAKYAEQHGVGDAYHAAMFRAYWQEAQDISDMMVLRNVADGVGLAGTAFVTALTNPEMIALVDSDIALAQENEITGVPAMVLLNRYLVMGAQPYEELARIIEQIKQKHGLEADDQE